MKILKLINALPIIAIGLLVWYSLQTPKTSRETVLSVPEVLELSKFPTANQIQMQQHLCQSTKS
jgi:hypothetical protein